MAESPEKSEDPTSDAEGANASAEEPAPSTQDRKRKEEKERMQKIMKRAAEVLQHIKEKHKGGEQPRIIIICRYRQRKKNEKKPKNEEGPEESSTP